MRDEAYKIIYIMKNLYFFRYLFFPPQSPIPNNGLNINKKLK